MRTRRLMVTTLSVLLLAIQTVLSVAQAAAPVPRSTADLLESFENEPVFWKQVELAKQIVARGDQTVLPHLEHWLSDEDRHRRGNAALIFGGLGDPRGFDVIVGILRDFSDRPEGQGIAAVVRGDGRYQVAEQIRSDRYYAVGLLGHLKDRRALPVLVPLLSDPDVNYIVTGSLGEIGGPDALDALIAALDNKSVDVRVTAILALEKMRARKAHARLRALLSDNERCHFDKLISVSEAARAALATLDAQ